MKGLFRWWTWDNSMSSVWYFPPWSFYISLNKSVCLMHTARGEINGSRLQCWIARDEEVSGTLIKGAEIPRRSSSFSLFDLICQQQWGEKKKRGLESGCWNSGGETGLHMPVCVRKPPNWHVWSGREQPHLVSRVFFFPRVAAVSEKMSVFGGPRFQSKATGSVWRRTEKNAVESVAFSSTNTCLV